MAIRDMPRDGSLISRDLIDKLAVLRVECDKCGRSGRYRVTTLAKSIGWDGAKSIGWDGKLNDWLYDLMKDCARKRSPGLSDPCGAKCPDLSKVL
jgi:hypothetical protein